MVRRPFILFGLLGGYVDYNTEDFMIPFAFACTGEEWRARIKTAQDNNPRLERDYRIALKTPLNQEGEPCQVPGCENKLEAGDNQICFVCDERKGG